MVAAIRGSIREERAVEEIFAFLRPLKFPIGT